MTTPVPKERFAFDSGIGGESRQQYSEYLVEARITGTPGNSRVHDAGTRASGDSWHGNTIRRAPMMPSRRVRLFKASHPKEWLFTFCALLQDSFIITIIRQRLKDWPTISNDQRELHYEIKAD